MIISSEISFIIAQEIRPPLYFLDSKISNLFGWYPKRYPYIGHTNRNENSDVPACGNGKYFLNLFSFQAKHFSKFIFIHRCFIIYIGRKET